MSEGACSGRIVSGELHYPRIPHEYWSARLAMARAMGLTAISTYVFWNRHEPEPGAYDFSEGNDVAQFIRLAQREGLDVILRPGPYVCAEWDFGGLPAWLLRDREMRVRTADERFLQPVRRWLRRLGEEIGGLQRAHGGPIVAVQLENEYGAFGADAAYLRALRSILAESGFGASPLYTIDQPGDLTRGALDGVPVAVTFAPGDPGAQFAQLAALRPGAPLLCGEYWAGWFDHWGERHQRLDDEAQARDLAWMLRSGASVNVYMFHGGTNFGFWSGANAFDPHPYQPTTTSYDYQAALDEAGRPTRKFYLFRDVIERETGVRPPPVPAVPRTIDVPACELNEVLPLDRMLPAPVRSREPRPMEDAGQSFGYMLYRSTVGGAQRGVLTIEDLRDYAVVMLDGRIAGHLDRRLGEASIELDLAGASAQLDILVENGGRINYGPKFPGERKGITRAVRWNGAALYDWRMYCLPFDTPPGAGYASGTSPQPAFYRGVLQVDAPADTFLDVGDLRKGSLWVNGRNAGRFWEIGPQRSLYVPGSWLRAGANEVAIFEFFGRERAPRVRGARDRAALR